MRLIINFFVFGFIFYLIYLFFPEAFATLVSWANAVYNFFYNLVQTVMEKMGRKSSTEEIHQAMAFAGLLLH